MSRRAACRSASLILLACLATTAGHAATYVRSYLVDNVLLPTSSSQAASYAIDLDGDTHAENYFGQALAAFAAQGFDFNGQMNAAVASGSIVHLVHLQTTDKALANDSAAQASWCVGTPIATPPLFDGTDAASCFTVPATYVAPLAGGSFTSANPATTANPVSLAFAFPSGTGAVNIPVLNARLSFATDAGGNITFGQINGSIPHSEIVNTFEPALDATCNASIQNDPSSSTAMGCKSVFDTGCAGHPELANDGQIELCEISENAIIAALLAPDVQVDDGGTMVPANSMGIRFTAIVYDRLFGNGFDH
jgi:hypothetical protein